MHYTLGLVTGISLMWLNIHVYFHNLKGVVLLATICAILHVAKLRLDQLDEELNDDE